MKYMNNMSPWGMIDECREVINGVYIIGTPSHGGILVERRVHDLFNYAAEKNAKNVPFSTLVGYASDNINFTILGAVKHG